MKEKLREKVVKILTFPSERKNRNFVPNKLREEESKCQNKRKQKKRSEECINWQLYSLFFERFVCSESVQTKLVQNFHYQTTKRKIL